MEALITVFFGVGLFVWPIWFLVTMNSMNNNLRNIFKELRLQGDWLEMIASSQLTQEDDGQIEEAQQTGEQWWCPNCKEYYFTKLETKKCPLCRQEGYPNI